MERLLELIRNADPLALYGALTGSIGLVFGAVAAYNALFDRPWLRIKAYLLRQRDGTRQVEVTLVNAGRRKAVCYPPYLRIYDRKLRLFFRVSADEIWADGHGWYENEERDRPLHDPLAVNEYDTIMYLFRLDPSHSVLWAAVMDRLQRTRRTSIRFGRLRYVVYRVLAFLNRP